MRFQARRVPEIPSNEKFQNLFDFSLHIGPHWGDRTTLLPLPAGARWPCWRRGRGGFDVGPLPLDGLGEGEWRVLGADEVRSFRTL